MQDKIFFYTYSLRQPAVFCLEPFRYKIKQSEIALLCFIMLHLISCRSAC